MKGFLLHSRDRVIEAFMWQNFNQIQILPTKKRRFRRKPPEEDHREKSELLKREQRVRERGAPTNKTQEVSQSKTVKLPLLCCSIIPPTRSSSYKSSNESSKLRNPLCVCDGNAYPRLVIQERKNEEKYKKNWNLQKEEEIKKGWRMVLL